MTKPQLMVALRERGIAFKPAQKKEELEALLSTGTAAPIPETQSEAEASMREPSEVTTQWRIYDHKGRLIRTYTVDAHGYGAAQLAAGFAGKIGGTIQES